MNINIDKLSEILCKSLCTTVKIYKKNSDLLFIETPFLFNDGDTYSIYIKELSSGGIRITDCGHTLMHLSYENEIEKFFKGTRGKIFEQILADTDVKIEKGAFYIDSSIENIGIGIFQFGQAITKIYGSMNI